MSAMARRRGATGEGAAATAIEGPRPHVVVVGGGFAGLRAARRLAAEPVDVTVVDRHNYHVFQPLLYQVATAGLSPGDIAQPIRHVLRDAGNATVLLGTVTAVDVAAGRVHLDTGSLAYDYLILAAGATHSYFGHDEWRPLAPGLKDIDDALEIRRRVLLAFEAAERATDDARRHALLTFVIIGGGPTGVELAGALVELSRHALAREFRRIDARQARIVLVEGGPRVLGTFAEPLSAKAARHLATLGVEVLTGTTVTRVAPGSIEAGAVRIAAETVLWAAGVTAVPLGRSLGLELARDGRVTVAPDLSVPGHPSIFVVGDLARFVEPDGRELPGLAPVAMQMGHHAADNVARLVRGEPTRPFRYRDRGMMATIGRNAAVAQVGRFAFDGLVGWLMWLLVHIAYLIGFRNRILVLFQWIWAYVTFDRGVRIITGPVSPAVAEAAAAGESDKALKAPPPRVVAGR
jgi:NADH dehydrogenase